METTLLDHEQFEGAKILAEIGAKIAAGRAALVELETSKEDFLTDREADAIARVGKVLEQSKELLDQCGNYHNELVSFRIQIGEFADDVRGLIQFVESWKSAFDRELAAKNADIDRKIIQNDALLTQIKQQRALLEGESEGIKGKRQSLAQDKLKINDEWQTLTRAAEEINRKK